MAGPVELLESATVGLAVGTAAADAFQPTFEAAKQKAWTAEQIQVLSAAVAAQLRAQGAISDDQAYAEAARTGYSADKVDALVQLALRAPGVGELITLYRRELIGDTAFSHGLRKAMLESQWDTVLLALKDEVLDPAIIANAIVRGIMADPGFLPVGPPTGAGKVKPFPVSPLNTLTEAAHSGVDRDRLFVMTAINGRPMAPEEAAKASFRNIIDKVDYQRAIAEGDIRNEWSDAIYDYTREILTARDHVELRLRGWYTTDAEMYAGTALHGMSQADTDLLFKVLGRPQSHRNVFLAQRRGGVYNETPADIDPAFLKSLQESNERPEWYGLEWALRFTQPSVFVVRQYLKDGGDPAWAETKLRYIGWEQADIDIFIKAYAAAAPGTAGGKLDTHLKSAVTAAIGAVRKAYTAGAIDATEADTFITQAEAATTLTGAWDVITAVGKAPHPPQQLADPALIAAVEAEGYTVTAPPPQPPQNVVELEDLGYTVVKTGG